jgi:hypothetical protein
MVEYNWSIPTTEYTKADGGIFTAHWRVTAVDGDFTASAYGSAGFTPDATSPDFKPYDEVTEAEVLGWVWASLDKSEIEAGLAAQIESQKAPATATGTPWG